MLPDRDKGTGNGKPLLKDLLPPFKSIFVAKGTINLMLEASHRPSSACDAVGIIFLDHPICRIIV